MSHLNTNFDNDMDSFLNLPQEDYTPASTSPNTQTPQLAPPQFASSSQTFSGPSFQYDAYRQQTGLPVGGLANTFAINQNAGLQHWDGQGSFVMPSESINLPLSKVEDFDFSRMDDLDFDADSPTIFGGSNGQFVSPTTLVSNASGSSTVQRIYPGMHSQAAQAKAQQAKQQQDMIRQQQQQQQQIARPLPAGQKPLPKGPAPKDPRIEESISRILNQMRQKSISSETKEEDSPSPNMSSMPRSRKDEEDMDEDERLLASEEGKKLTSKERRQLRNKVSARAFRSRRKEYIGQLEGDLATKADENSVLRNENQQLREENNRLTDLTRMLLSSQSFSGFLQELSQSGVPTQGQRPTAQPAMQERTQQQTQQHPRKDINPADAARQITQQQPQIGMALMPETNVDLSLFGSWNSGVNANDFQVFAVTELPADPVLDLSKLSEKPDLPVSIAKSDSSKSLPTLPEMPEAVKTTMKAKADRPAVRATGPVALMSSNSHLSCSKSESTQTSTRLSTVTAAQDLDALCAELEETSGRLSALLPRV